MSTQQALNPDAAYRVRARAPDWRTQLDESQRGPLRTWLWSVAAMTFAVMVVGGITRLTQSGLSIVDWQPLMGVIPPLNEAQWQETFDRYRQFPEYQKLRQGMTLAEFRFIFFWEYLHRLLARTIGLVFLVPFVVFWLRGRLTAPLARRTLVLFALGGMQGVLGWLMVRSGLVERPSVSHFRLAAHLTLAFLIFGGCIWLIRELQIRDVVTAMRASTRRVLTRGLTAIGALLALQIVWGAFVAGLKAGKSYNTFPLMGGRIVPPDLLALEPALLNFVHYGPAVQWTHRVLGTLLLAAALALFVRLRRDDVDPATRRFNVTLCALLTAQYALGIATLVLAVPVALGVAHQALAMVVFGVWLAWVHHLHTTVPASGGETAATTGESVIA